MLLQAGQLLSNAGTQSTSIAYPLLVLAVTGSAAKAGVVAFARTLPAAPPLGGALYGLARALPFLVDAVSYTFSTLSLLAMRTPFQEEREPALSRLRPRLAEGFRFLWRQPFLRTSALLFGLSNFIG